MAWFDAFKGRAKAASDETHTSESPQVAPAAASSGGNRAAIVSKLSERLVQVWRLEGRDPARVDVDPGLDLYDSGYLTSLNGPQFLVLAEKDFGVKLPDWLLGGRASSLLTLAEYIEGQLAGQKDG